MKTSWVFDTNVLVSGILNPHGYPGRLWDSVLNDRLRLTLDDRILVEYHQVLSRPKFRLTLEKVEAIMTFLGQEDLVAPVPLAIQLSDPDDLPFLEAALLATDRVLVTGNAKHFPQHKHHGVKILTPAQAWHKLIKT